MKTSNRPSNSANLALIAGLLLVWVAFSMMAGFTPGRILKIITGQMDAVMLVLFWVSSAAIFVVTAVVCYYWQQFRSSGYRWPLSPFETITAVALAAVTLSISSETFPANEIKIGLFHFLFLLLALAGTVEVVRQRCAWPNLTRLRPLLLTIVLLFGFLGLNVQLTGDWPRGAAALLRHWSYFGWFFLLLMFLRRGRNLLFLLQLLILLGLVVSGYGIAQHYGYELPVTKWGQAFSLPELNIPGRSISTFGNPNFTGAFLVLVIPLLIGKYLTARNRWFKALIVMQLLVVMLGLHYTYNRAGYLAFLVSFAFLIVVARGYRRQLGILFILWLLLLLGSGTVQERLLFWTDEMSGDDSIRVALWGTGMRMVAADFWLGCGWGNFNQCYAPYLGYDFFRYYTAPEYVVEHVHSEFLEVWVESGTGGLIVVLLICTWLGVLMWRSHRAEKQEPLLPLVCLAAFLAALTHALFATKLRYESTAVPLVLIMVAPLLTGQLRNLNITGDRTRRAPRNIVLAVLIVLLAVFGLAQTIVSLAGNRLMKEELDVYLSFIQDPGRVPVQRLYNANERAYELMPGNLLLNTKRLLYATEFTGFTGNLDATLATLREYGRDYQDVAFMLAKYELQRSNYPQALAWLDYYHGRYPFDQRTTMLRAQVFLQSDAPGAVLETLAGFSGTRKENEYAAFLRMRAWLQMGEKERAARVMERLRARYPDYLPQQVEYHPAFIQLQKTIQQKDNPQALALISQLLHAYGPDGIPPLLKGTIQKYANELFSDEAGGGKYLLGLGDIFAGARQPHQAMTVYRAAGSMAGISARTAWDRIGWLGLQEDTPSMIGLAAQQLEALMPGTVDAEYLHARYYEGTGDRRPALAVYKEILTRRPLHLGVLGRLGRYPGELPDQELRQMILTACQSMSISPEDILASDERINVAVPPAQLASLDKRTRELALWVTPQFTDTASGRWAAAWYDMNGREISAREFKEYNTPSGQTTKIAVRIPLLPAVCGSDSCVLVLYRHPVKPDDWRPEYRWEIATINHTGETVLPVAQAATPDTGGPDFTGWLARFVAEPGAAVPASVSKVTSWDWYDARYTDEMRTLAKAYLAAGPNCADLLAWIFKPENTGRLALFEVSNRHRRYSQAATLLLLDALVQDGIDTIPRQLWRRPYAQGNREDYWIRWQGTAVYREPEFRRAIGEVLLRQARYADLLAWLDDGMIGNVPDAILRTAALAGLGRREEAMAVWEKTAATDSNTADWQWHYGLWRKENGLPVTENIQRLQELGADGWALLLAGQVPPGSRPDFVPIEFESGLYIVGSTICPAAVRAGETFPVNIWVVPGEDMPAGLGMHLALGEIDSGSSNRCFYSELSTLDYGTLKKGHSYYIPYVIEVPPDQPYTVSDYYAWVFYPDLYPFMFPYLPQSRGADSIYGGITFGPLTIIPAYFPEPGGG